MVTDKLILNLGRDKSIYREYKSDSNLFCVSREETQTSLEISINKRQNHVLEKVEKWWDFEDCEACRKYELVEMFSKSIFCYMCFFEDSSRPRP